MKGLKVREFIPQKDKGDFEKLLPAYMSIWNDSVNMRFLSFTLKEFREEMIRSWFTHHLDMGGRYFVLTDMDETIAGISVIKASSVEGFEVFGFAVSPGFKGKGAGTLLLHHVLDVAKNEGYCAVRIGVFTDNKPMLALLIRHDFIPSDIKYHACDDGRDILYLKRYLD